MKTKGKNALIEIIQNIRAKSYRELQKGNKERAIIWHKIDNYLLNALWRFERSNKEREYFLLNNN